MVQWLRFEAYDREIRVRFPALVVISDLVVAHRCPGLNPWAASGLLNAKFFSQGYSSSFFLILAHLWWFGVLGLGSYIGFLGVGVFS